VRLWADAAGAGYGYYAESSRKRVWSGADGLHGFRSAVMRYCTDSCRATSLSQQFFGCFSSLPTLNSLVKVSGIRTKNGIDIIGHTISTRWHGAEIGRLSRGTRRVASLLTSRAGVAGSRIQQAVWCGPDQPLPANDYQAGRASETAVLEINLRPCKAIGITAGPLR